MQADKRIYPLRKIRWLSFKRAATLLLLGNSMERGLFARAPEDKTFTF